MKAQDVMNEVFQILSFVDRDKRKNRLYQEEDAKKPLTGKEMGFSAREMTYIALEVMKRFDVQLNKEDVIGYAFNSVDQITEIVLRKQADAGSK